MAEMEDGCSRSICQGAVEEGSSQAHLAKWAKATQFSLLHLSFADCKTKDQNSYRLPPPSLFLRDR